MDVPSEHDNEKKDVPVMCVKRRICENEINKRPLKRGKKLHKGLQQLLPLLCYYLELLAFHGANLDGMTPRICTKDSWAYLVDILRLLFSE